MRPSVAVEESLRVLGRNIKTARLKRRVPQEVLAERAGIGLSTLTHTGARDGTALFGNFDRRFHDASIRGRKSPETHP